MIQRTKSGLFVRDDNSLGMLIYSPFTSMLYSCAETSENAKIIRQWLNLERKDFFDPIYLEALGPGWHSPLESAVFQSNRFLTSIDKSIVNKKPEYPLVINWLITNKCNGKCKYCYANDIIGECYENLTVDQVKKIGDVILSYNPLAVVITGGDPLVSDHLEIALKHLSKKVGVIVDTNGLSLTPKHIKAFKKYGVFVRISLDSQSPRRNNLLRQSKTGACSLEGAISAIDNCLSNDISVGVHTVVTNNNIGDILPLSEKLPRVGVLCWRIQLVANHSKFKDYNKFAPSKKRFYKNIIPKVLKTLREEKRGIVFVDVVHNNIPESVVLVLPNGKFCTELTGVGKVPIDPINEFSPRIESFRDGVLNREGHTSRYLGNATERYE